MENYLKAKMLEFVEMEKDALPKKVKAFKATGPWRIGCDQ